MNTTALSADLLAKVRLKERANIIAKVAAGKLMSAKEREIVGVDTPAENPPARGTTGQRWTISAGAREFGITERTLGKALTMAHMPAGRGVRYTTLQLHRALAGDLQAEKIRLTRADADEREMSNRVAAGELVSMDAARKVIAQVLAPVRSKLMALPPSLAVRCNPSDPEMARREIEIAVDEVLKGTQ